LPTYKQDTEDSKAQSALYIIAARTIQKVSITLRKRHRAYSSTFRIWADRM